jgi:hypothetical protein
MNAADTARTLRAIASYEADARIAAARIEAIRVTCPDAATFEAHPEVKWQRLGIEDCNDRIAAFRAALAAV